MFKAYPADVGRILTTMDVITTFVLFNRNIVFRTAFIKLSVFVHPLIQFLALFLTVFILFTGYSFMVTVMTLGAG